MASLCHPWFTTTNLPYRFPDFETSATALCGTTGNKYIYLKIPKQNLVFGAWTILNCFFGIFRGPNARFGSRFGARTPLSGPEDAQQENMRKQSKEMNRNDEMSWDYRNENGPEQAQQENIRKRNKLDVKRCTDMHIHVCNEIFLTSKGSIVIKGHMLC